ncbi:MAG: glycerate kinase [Microthrixaceae bacterium]
MRILVAPDKFRGTLSAAQAATALSAGLLREGHEVLEMPLADGGEGTLDVLGGANRSTVVSNPLGDPVEAQWRLAKRVAVIEMSRASGLSLVGGAEGNDAVAASTHGTGELITSAMEHGAKQVIVGVGGSATTDGGLGALRAMYPLERLKGVEMTVACDVAVGFVDAARTFGPQKGATEAQVELLERRLERLAGVYLEDHGVDVLELDGAGAAGGLAGGLAAVGAELVSGFDLVAEHLGLDVALEGVDAVVTGEGFLDAESFDGKVVGGVLDAALHSGTPVVAVVGQAFDDAADHVPTVSLTERFGMEQALGDAGGCMFEAAAAVVEMLDSPAG